MGKVIFGCVTDQKQKFLDQAVRLVASLRWFGGSVADAPFIVCAVGGMPDAYYQCLSKLGADIRVVERFEGDHAGPSNKLRFLEVVPWADYQSIILIDCDTIIVQDPSAYLPTQGFSAKLADLPTVNISQFRELFSKFGMPMPTSNVQPGVPGAPAFPYFNSGVCIIANDVFTTLRDSWIKWNRRLILISSQQGFDLHVMDQASLTMALVENNIFTTLLPLEMNLPVHFAAARYPLHFYTLDPVIIHYHSLAIDGGGIAKLPLKGARRRVQMFNERLAAEKLLPVESL